MPHDSNVCAREVISTGSIAPGHSPAIKRASGHTATTREVETRQACPRDRRGRLEKTTRTGYDQRDV